MPGTFLYRQADGTAYREINIADAATNFNAVDGVSELGSSNDDYSANARAGTDVVDFARGAGEGGIYHNDLGAGTPWDMEANDYTYPFLYTAKTGERIINGVSGVRIRVRSTASGTSTDHATWDLCGAVDAGDFFPALVKAWNYFILSGTEFTVSNGTVPNFNSIRYIEVRYNWSASNTGNQQPAFAMDWWKLGRDIRVTGGTAGAPADMPSLLAWNDGDPADRVNDPDWGLVFAANVFYELWAGVEVGDGTASTVFVAENLFLFNNQFSRQVEHGWYVRNNATLTLGKLDQKVQNDYAINGCQLVWPDEIRRANLEIDNGATFNCYATKIFRAQTVSLGESAAGTDPTIDIQGCDFDTVQNIEFRSTNLDILNTQFHDPSPTLINASGAWTDDAGVYGDITTAWNASGGSTAVFPATEAVGDGHIFGSSEQFTTAEFVWATAGAGGALTFQYWDGLAWQDLSNVVDGTSNFTQDGRVSWDQPTDWATRQLSAEGQQYYVRAVIDTVFTTNPLIDQGQIGQRRVGSLFDAPNSLEAVTFFNCDRALRFAASVTVTGYVATDNFYDAVIDDGLTVTLVNSVFDRNKLLQI